MKLNFKLAVLLVIIGFIGFYLNRAYRHTYNFIGTHYKVEPVLEKNHLVGEPTANTIKFVALGDSLTAGVGVDNASETFPHQLAKRIAKERGQSVRLWNLGMPGGTAKHILDYQLPEALALQPDFVTIIVGVNDAHAFRSIDDFSGDLQSVITQLQNAGVKVVIGSTPFIGDRVLMWPPYNLLFKFQTKRFAIAVNDVAKNTGATLVQLNIFTNQQAWRTGEYYAADHFHPNSLGYLQWSNLFYDTIYRK